MISLKKSFVKDKHGNVLLPQQSPRHASGDKIAALLEKNEQLENDLADLTKKYQRALSDYENAHKLLTSLEKHQQETKVKVEEVTSELLTTEIEHLKRDIEDRDKEIFYLQKSNKAAKEASEKLNRVINENRVRFENEKTELSKVHKAEVKGWKRKLGKVNSKVVKLEKALKVFVDTNEEPVTLPLKSKPISSDIFTFNSNCDDADAIIDDYKPVSDDSSSQYTPCLNMSSQLKDPATAEPCSTPPPSPRSQSLSLSQAGTGSPRTPPGFPTCTGTLTVQAKLKEARDSGKKLDYESLVALLQNHPWE